jgi:NADH-quinone oxidoreductase subunit J
MVLFLFIIMLLDLKAEQRRSFNKIALVGGSVVAFGFAAQLIGVLSKFKLGQQEFPPLANTPDDVRAVGQTLFTSYNLPFQVVGVLILIATIGVIVISKRELK